MKLNKEERFEIFRHSEFRSFHSHEQKLKITSKTCTSQRQIERLQKNVSVEKRGLYPKLPC